MDDSIPADPYGKRQPPADISVPAPGLSRNTYTPFDYDAEEKIKKKRRILFAILAFLFLVVFVFAVVGIRLITLPNNESDGDDGTPNNGAIVDPNTNPSDLDDNPVPDDQDNDKPFGCTTIAEPDPATEYITYTLPDCASPVRLSLPASVDDIFFSAQTGITGFGVHAGGHPEGLDHVWIELKPGTPVKSWADGTVRDIRRNDDYSDITIDYGRNLVGTHMEILTSYVKEGDQVDRGQEIGIGASFDQNQSSAEFALLDEGRTDGVSEGQGSLVSPFDYLEENEKEALIEAYKQHVLTPYRNGNKAAGGVMFYPYQPFLTNRLLLHNGNEGKISGEWYLRETWIAGFPPDILSFVESDTAYFRGCYAAGGDHDMEGGHGKVPIRIDGACLVDYERRTIRISNIDGTTYYGIFSIDDSRPRAILMLELQTGSYPKSFTENVLEYIERDPVSRWTDGEALGVLGE